MEYTIGSLYALCSLLYARPNLQSTFSNLTCEHSTPFSYTRQAATGKELSIKGIPGYSRALDRPENEIGQRYNPCA